MPSVTAAARVVDNFRRCGTYRCGVSNLHEFFNAVRQGDVDGVARILIREPLLIHARDETGATALQYAAENDDQDIVGILIAAGASFDVEP